MGDTLSLWCVLGVTGALQVFLCLSLPLPSPWVWLSGGQWISAILPKPLQVPSSFPACRNVLPASLSIDVSQPEPWGGHHGQHSPEMLREGPWEGMNLSSGVPKATGHSKGQNGAHEAATALMGSEQLLDSEDG